MPSVHNRRTRTAGTPQGGAVGPPCRRPAQREKEFPHMSKRRGRHAARRPARRFVLLAIGLTLAAAAAVLIGGPFLRATPSAAHPDAAPVELDAQRSGSVDQVSRDHQRSPSPSAPPARPSPPPSRPGAPVARPRHAQNNKTDGHRALLRPAGEGVRLAEPGRRGRGPIGAAVGLPWRVPEARGHRPAGDRGPLAVATQTRCLPLAVPTAFVHREGWMSAAAPPDGFVEFVATRSPVLLRSAWLLTGDVGKAEDLLQTVLALVWPRWRRGAAGGDPEAYIRRVLFTTYLSWRRRRWRYEVPTSTVPDRGDRTDLAGDSANRDAVQRALGRLSRQQRAVVVLRYVEDLSLAETAELLNCSVATVKVQAGRALAALRTDPQLQLSFVGEEVGRE